jgi:hypothetical protein
MGSATTRAQMLTSETLLKRFRIVWSVWPTVLNAVNWPFVQLVMKDLKFSKILVGQFVLKVNGETPLIEKESLVKIA